MVLLIKENYMEIVYRYRAREITVHDIDFIKEAIRENYGKGRSYISRKICESWNWLQPDGKYKEYAARDLLLRLEEKGYIELPPRIKNKNNTKERSYEQIPLFFKQEDLSGLAGDYHDVSVKISIYFFIVVNPKFQNNKFCKCTTQWISIITIT